MIPKAKNIDMQNAHTQDNLATEKKNSLIKGIIAFLGIILTLSYFSLSFSKIHWSLIVTIITLTVWFVINGFFYQLLNKAKFLKPIIYITTIVDILIVSFINFVLILELPFSFLNCPIVALYFVVIATAALRKNNKIVIQVGIVCAVVHIAFSIFNFHINNLPFYFSIHSQNELGFHWSFANDIIIAISMAAFGLIVGYVTKDLIDSENHYLALFNSIPDGILIVSTSLRILASNKKFQELVGAPNDVFYQKPLKQFLGQNAASYTMSSEHDLVNESLFAQLRTVDGITIPVQVSQVPIIWSKEKCFEFSIRDMSKTHELELKLARAQKVQTIGKLAGGLAHDFNNILGGIFGATSLATRTLSKMDDNTNVSSLSGYFDTIKDCGKTATQILDRLSTFSRSTIVETTSVDVMEVLKDSAAVFTNTFDERVKIIIENSNSLMVKADRTSLSQAILNLCINAGDAIGPNEGTVILRAFKLLSTEVPSSYNLSPNKQYICIQVEDDGPGMDEDTQRKIFDPFFTTKKKGEGTGIGLSMVHNVAFGHGGCVVVESELDKGTTFSFYIEAGRDSLIPI